MRTASAMVAAPRLAEARRLHRCPHDAPPLPETVPGTAIPQSIIPCDGCSHRSTGARTSGGRRWADPRQPARAAAEPDRGRCRDRRRGLHGPVDRLYLERADPALRICVLEREFAGFGASGRNGGWVWAPSRAAHEAMPRASGALRCARSTRMFGDGRGGRTLSSPNSDDADSRPASWRSRSAARRQRASSPSRRQRAPRGVSERDLGALARGARASACGSRARTARCSRRMSRACSRRGSSRASRRPWRGSASRSTSTRRSARSSRAPR